MAERTDAAARSTRPQGLTSTSAELMQPHNIPPDRARPPCSAWTAVGPGRRRRRRRERRQKRGCRAGLLVRLRKQPVRPALPSIVWSNARSMVNKTDELELLMAENRHSRDCCVTIITETWLHSLVPDAAVQLTSRTMHKQTCFCLKKNSFSGPVQKRNEMSGQCCLGIRLKLTPPIHNV